MALSIAGKVILGTNLLIELLKGTSLVSLITLADLSFRANQLVEATFRSGEGPNDVGSSRHHLIRAVEDSLRRLKTDRSIIRDLPEKIDIREYCNLTREQATAEFYSVTTVLSKEYDVERTAAFTVAVVCSFNYDEPLPASAKRRSFTCSTPASRSYAVASCSKCIVTPKSRTAASIRMRRMASAAIPNDASRRALV